MRRRAALLAAASLAGCAHHPHAVTVAAVAPSQHSASLELPPDRVFIEHASRSQSAPRSAVVPVTTTTVAGTMRTPRRQASGDVWSRLAECESGGDPTANTGNGFYGAFQFTRSTWDSLHTGYPRADLAPYAVQLAAAERLLARSGPNQWPVCSRKVGLR